MSSITQSVPDRDAFLVEYPGFVNNADAAIQTLGSLEAISATADGASPVLTLHLRPGDPLSHPLLGYKQNTRGLLLRISRKAGAKAQKLIGHFDMHAGCQTTGVCMLLSYWPCV